MVAKVEIRGIYLKSVISYGGSDTQKCMQNTLQIFSETTIGGSSYRRPGTGTRFLNSRQERSPDRHDVSL